MQQQLIKISKLKNNSGQIEGLPKNPRLVRDTKFEKLVTSIQEDPEMLELRELIVYPFNDEFVVIAGNMRLRAMQHLKFKECVCKVLPIETPIEKLKAYTIKDNLPYGETDWELIANEWDTEQLTEWGLDLPVFDTEKLIAKTEQLKDFARSHVLISYHPDNHEKIQKLLEELNELSNVEIELASN